MIEISGKQYLTVKEFSEQAKISRQAVYSQLSTRLDKFTIQVDNKTMIEKTALDVFYSSQLEQVSSQVEQVSKQDIDPQKQEKNLSDATNQLIDMLKEEIKKKDLLIERLQDSLDKAYIQIADNTKIISDMAQKAQYITAADKTDKIMQTAAEHDDLTNPEEPEKKKKGIREFLRGLFN